MPFPFGSLIRPSEPSPRRRLTRQLFAEQLEPRQLLTATAEGLTFEASCTPVLQRNFPAEPAAIVLHPDHLGSEESGCDPHSTIKADLAPPLAGALPDFEEEEKPQETAENHSHTHDPAPCQPLIADRMPAASQWVRWVRTTPGIASLTDGQFGETVWCIASDDQPIASKLISEHRDDPHDPVSDFFGHGWILAGPWHVGPPDPSCETTVIDAAETAPVTEFGAAVCDADSSGVQPTNPLVEPGGVAANPVPEIAEAVAVADPAAVAYDPCDAPPDPAMPIVDEFGDFSAPPLETPEPPDHHAAVWTDWPRPQCRCNAWLAYGMGTPSAPGPMTPTAESVSLTPPVASGAVVPSTNPLGAAAAAGPEFGRMPLHWWAAVGAGFAETAGGAAASADHEGSPGLSSRRRGSR